MSARTAGELTTLRSAHPHISNIYMSVLVPEIVYIGQVTGSPARGDRVITVSDVSGTISNIVEGMTVLVGTSSGEDNVSRRRFRSRSGQDLTVDENSTVWANGQYITVIEFWELWPIFPFIDETPPYIFYKDRDITYAAAGNPNSQANPVAIIDGGHKVGMLRGSSITFPLVGSKSYPIAPGASISSHAWVCPGGSIANASASSTTVSFTVPGTYQLSLTVTDSNGKSQVTRRVIQVHGETTNYPIVDFELASPITGTYQKGGWRTTVSVRANATSTTIPDRSLVIIWYEGFYDGTEQYIGENGNILLAGYIRKDSIKRDLRAGSVTFEITTIEDLLKKHNMFSVSLTDVASPSVWWEYLNLTVARAVHHFWKWHSTLLTITNVFLPVQNTTRLPAVDDFANGTLYSLVEGFANQHGIAAHIVCNKMNDLHVEINIQMLNDADRAAKTQVMKILPQDRRGDVDVEIIREPEKRVSFVMLSGVTYDGTTTTPIIAKAPGEVPDAEGSGMDNVERQVLASQTEANERVGRYLALHNIIIADVRIPLAGMYVFADIAPQEWYLIDLDASDTKRGLVFSDLKLVPRMVVINRTSGALLVDTTYEAEATGNDGIPGRFPTSVPPPPPPVYPELFEGLLVAFNDAEGCYVEGSWVERNGALAGVNIQDQFGGVDPWWFTANKQSSLNPADSILWKCDVGAIFRSLDQGVTWVNETPLTGPDGYDPTDFTYIYYEGDSFVESRHVFLSIYDDAGTWVSYILLTEDDGAAWTWKSTGIGGAILDVTAITADKSADQPQSSAAVDIDGTYVAFIVNASETSSPARLIIVDTSDNTIKSVTSVGSQTGAANPNLVAVCKLATNRLAITCADGDSLSIHTEVLNFVDGAVSTSVKEESIIAYTGGAPTALSIVRLSDTLYAIACNRTGTTNKGFIVGCEYDVGGNTLAIGAEYDFDTDPVGYIAMTDATTGAHIYWPDTSLARLVGRSFTISTGTLVVSYSSVLKVSDALPDNISAVNLTGDKDFIVFVNTEDSQNAYGVVVTITGNTITFADNGTELKDGAIIALYVSRISDTSVYVSYLTSARVPSYNTVTISGHTVDSVGTESAYPTGAEGYPIAYSGPTGLILLYFDDDYTGLTNPDFHVFVEGGASGKLLGGSISKGFGTKLYVTMWENAGRLSLQVYSFPELLLQLSVPLASCSEAELDAGTYSVYPYADYQEVEGQILDDLCFLYGRLADDLLAFGSISQVIYTDDGGTTYFQLVGDWNEDSCGSFITDANGRLYAMRNKSVGATLYRGIISLSLEKASVPFRVNPGAFTRSRSGYLIVGGIAANGSVQIMYSKSPYNEWIDFTQDYPLGGAVTSLVIV